jgi:hypothetical protein
MGFEAVAIARGKDKEELARRPGRPSRMTSGQARFRAVITTAT